LSDDIGEPAVDLAFIRQALQRLTSEVASLRDDTRVLTAIVQRLDNSHGRLLEEIRAIHRQQSRFGDRLRQLEEQP
jgi:chromosome segregation ATPase